ncbi:MAG: ketopantoate reductase family protein, partial [Methylobacteriaceae bacterium]|nr:ketopantoate reductase family protein [Methylobacteriaceae bacterium]
NELIISDVVGRERTVGAFINFGADYISPGLIHFGGRGAFVLGELDGRRSERIEALHRDISAFEPNAIITDNIMGYLWGKLGYGALLFATALTDASIVDALGAEEAQPIHRQLACEAVAVAHALAVTPLGFNGYDPAAFAPRAAAGAACASFAAMVAHNAKSTKTHSGIWRDLAVRKRKTEVDAQLGPIVRFGRESGVPTPATQELIAMIHEIEDGVRSLAWENLAELALKARRQGEVDRIPASGSGGQLSIPPE